MFTTPSPLAAVAREAIVDALNGSVADLIDLHSHARLAHWNLRGPYFAQLHSFFERFAALIAAPVDELAERAVTLGGRAIGTSRQVAARSRLPEYPVEASRDLDHVGHLATRLEAALVGLSRALACAQQHGDDVTVDLLVGAKTTLEKQGWMLRATAEGVV